MNELPRGAAYVAAAYLIAISVYVGYWWRLRRRLSDLLRTEPPPR